MSSRAGVGVEQLDRRLIEAIIAASAPRVEGPRAQIGVLAERLVDAFKTRLADFVPDVDCFANRSAIESAPQSLPSVDGSPEVVACLRQPDGANVAFVRLSAAAIDWWVHAALGAPVREESFNNSRVLSQIEVELSRVILNLLVDSLNACFAEAGVQLPLALDKVATQSDKQLDGMSDEPVWAIAVSLSRSPISRVIEVMIAGAHSQQWASGWANNQMRRKPTAAGPPNLRPSHRSSVLPQVGVEVDVSLGEQLIELEGLCDWVVGSTIRLSATAQSQVYLSANGIVLFSGVLGRMGSRLSVQITEAGGGDAKE